MWPESNEPRWGWGVSPELWLREAMPSGKEPCPTVAVPSQDPGTCLSVEQSCSSPTALQGFAGCRKEPSGRARSTCAGRDEQDGEAGKGLGCLHGKGRTGAWENSLGFRTGGSRCPQGLRGMHHLLSGGAGVSTLHVLGLQGHRLPAHPGCSGVTVLLQDGTWEHEALRLQSPPRTTSLQALRALSSPCASARSPCPSPRSWCIPAVT